MGTGSTTNKKNEKYLPGHIISVKRNILEEILKQTQKSICKIICNNGIIGTGFFCFLPFPNKGKKLPTLITNNHILNESDIEIGKSIKFSINDEKKYFNIIIDETRKVYTNDIYDITIIELYKEKDGIKEDDSFLEVDDKIIDDNMNDYFEAILKNKSIYIIHYPGGDKLEHAEGMIKLIDEDKCTIHHTCNTRSGSSGSPICFLDNNKLIGIHVGAHNDEDKWNVGTLLSEPIKDFNEKYFIKNNNNDDRKKEDKKNEFSLLDENNNNLDNNFYLNNNINIVNNNKRIINNDNDTYNDNNNFKYNENSSNINSDNLNMSKSRINFPEKNIVDQIIIVYKKRTSNFKDFYYNLGTNLFMNETISNQKFFGEIFVKNNKDKCKIIYKEKEYELFPYFQDIISEYIGEELTIKLIGISKITDCTNMFFGCTSLYSLPDIQKWDTKNITDMTGMFTYCRSLNPFPDISGWNTKNVKSFKNFFCYCREIEYLPDISRWDISNVVDISHMFDCCISVKYLPDISKWNTFNVTNMSALFASCMQIQYLPDISNWLTHKVKSMSLLFSECHSLIFIADISKWNTEQVEDMYKFFSNCHSLEVLPDISLWNTKNVKNMTNMFCGCYSLTSFPDILNWELNDSVQTNGMFMDFSKNAITDKNKLDQYTSKFKLSSSIFNSLYDSVSKKLFKQFV